MERTAVYPGSFDPVTNGHLDIIQRSACLFDHLIVAVADNKSKKPVFTLAERCAFLKTMTADLSNVEVEISEGLLVDYLKTKHATTIVKGLRAISDFDYEFQMALTNRKLAPNIETVFLMTNSEYSFLSSSVVKEVGRYGGDISSFVPLKILPSIQAKLIEMGGKRK